MMEVYSQIKEGDVLMIESLKKSLYTSLVPRNIQRVTRSKYHHAAIVKEHKGELWVYEAVFKGFVRTVPLYKWVAKIGLDYNAIVFRPSLNDQWQERLYTITGSPYDFGALIIHQLIYQIFKKIGFNVWLGRRGAKALNRIYCTEGVAYIIGYENWWLYDPLKLYKALYNQKIVEVRNGKVI